MSESEPKIIPIPPNVTLEIKRLHLDLVAKAKTFEAARCAFGEFMRSTKKILNVPNLPFYELSEDGTHFKEKK
jgi:hypothetical protein